MPPTTAAATLPAGADARTATPRWTPGRIVQLLLGALCSYLGGFALTAALTDTASLGTWAAAGAGVAAAVLLATGIRLVTGTLR